MFKQTRVDPYYDHYLRDSLTYYVQKTGDLMRNTGNDLPFMVSPSDMINGDKIKLESLQQFKYNVKERLKGSDAKKYITTAKTKRARALVLLEDTDGKGEITVNRRKFLEYFSHGYCRSRVMQP